MSYWFIDAADVLFFKDGREIAPGSEYTAASVFPPNPQTLYGALRSSLLAGDPDIEFSEDSFGNIDPELSEIAGTKQKTGSLAIRHFSLALKDKDEVVALYRLPNDILKRKKPEKEEQNAVVKTQQVGLSDFGIRMNMPISGMKQNWFVHDEGAFFEYEPIYLKQADFEAYLLGETALLERVLYGEVEQHKPEAYFTKEPRMGIVIKSDTNTVEDGKLFTTPFIRLNFEKGVGFLAALEPQTDNFGHERLLRLGGDGKLAHLKKVPQPKTGFAERLVEKLTGKTSFKAVLVTPAIFTEGWLPDGFDAQTSIKVIEGTEIKLTGSSLGRHANIGGWDLASRRPKSTKRAVQPGAVFYFETGKPLDSAFIRKLHGSSLCGNLDYQKQGLGIIHLGVI